MPLSKDEWFFQTANIFPGREDHRMVQLAYFPLYKLIRLDEKSGLRKATQYISSTL